MRTILLLLVLLAFSECSSQKDEKENVDAASYTLAALPQTVNPITQTQIEEFESRFPNGRLKVKGVLKNGKRDGLWISWYENGQQWSESVYTNGLKNGPTASWHENGRKRYEGFYKDDLKTGKWMYWDEEGNPVKENN